MECMTSPVDRLPAPAASDAVDQIVREWHTARPDLDTVSLAVFSRITRIAKRLDAVRKRAFAESGLELWEFDVLAALRRSGGEHVLSPKRLIETNMVSSGTMTNRISRLEERGLVTREEDPSDGRGVLVRMEAAGLELVDQAMTRLIEAEQALLESLEPGERDELVRMLRTLSIAAEQDAG